MGRSCRAGMGTDNGTVDADMLEVGLKTECRVELVPDAEPAPARKALEDAVPSSEAAGKHPPLGTGAQYPKHRFDEPAAAWGLQQSGTLRGAQQSLYPCPSVIAQLASVDHGKSQILALGLRQQGLVW
ncbi:hypothetical protein GCM10027398_32790 [Azotobacter salinestris]